ncbi:MAG: Nif11-like leader peptide family RiPP precursor [Oscillospiraceae bacterium]
MTTNEFIEKLAKDEALAKKMECCKCPDEAFAVAKEVGLTDDIESFKTVMTAVNKHINDELSDDELEIIAGGMSDTAVNVIKYTIDGVVIVGFIAAAA